MNKTQILKKFKESNNIKRIMLNYKSNEQIKQEFINNIKTDLKNIQTNEPISDTDIKQNLKEDKKSFSFGNVSVFKNFNQKVSFINSLSYDITTTKIKDYDKTNKGEWFKTEYAIYELKGV